MTSSDTLKTPPLIALKTEYEWQDDKPIKTLDQNGKFPGANVFKKHIPKDANIIVELGAWLGESTNWFCKHAPDAAVIVIDRWQGNSEHRKSHDRHVQQALTRLFPNYIHHTWKNRNRIIPVKRTTVNGLQHLRDQNITPDVIFLASDPNRKAVYNELKLARTLFPEIRVYGDFWSDANVRDGIRLAVYELGLPRNSVVTAGRYWWLKG